MSVLEPNVVAHGKASPAEAKPGWPVQPKPPSLPPSDYAVMAPGAAPQQFVASTAGQTAADIDWSVVGPAGLGHHHRRRHLHTARPPDRPAGGNSAGDPQLGRRDRRAHCSS